MTGMRIIDHLRPALAACVAFIAATCGAAQPMAVLERAGTVLERIVPGLDGSLAVVSEGEVDVVMPVAADAGWHARLLAEASDAQMFADAWQSGGRWWALREDSQNEAHTLWNLVMIGPMQASGPRPTPAHVAATLVRRCQPLGSRQIVRDPGGGRWLARVAGEEPGDRGVLRAFDERGTPNPRFDAAAAQALGGLAPAAFVAGAGGGWWVSATDGPSLHEHATLVKLGPGGQAIGAFGRDGRVDLAASGGASPASTQVVSHALLDDGRGTLWAMVSERARPGPAVAAAPVRVDELRAYSSDTGGRQADLEPPPPLQRELWSDLQDGHKAWSGFVRNAMAPTACVAAEQPAGAGWSLRCVVRRGGAWQRLGEPVTLAKVGSVGDVVVDPHEPGRLIVGAERAGHVVVLFAWRP